MRLRSYLQQLVHLVRRLLHWLQLDTRRGRFDLLSTCSLVLMILDYGKPGHGHAFAWLLLYLYASPRAK